MSAIKAVLVNITDSYKENYVNRFVEGDLPHNVNLVAELQLELANELKGVSESIVYEQFIKNLHKEFIEFSTNY